MPGDPKWKLIIVVQIEEYSLEMISNMPLLILTKEDYEIVYR